MSQLLLTSDLHLGHKNIIKFRYGFETLEDHDEFIFDNLASSINKRDSIIFLGDVAFSKEWLNRIASIQCAKKTLILGNHDLERGITMSDLMITYDRIESLYNKRNVYFTHCPIHPSQFRGKSHNIHGHLHNDEIDDDRYINVCVDKTSYRPVPFSSVL